MLKLEIESLEGLDDSLKPLYEEKGGKFSLKVEGLPDVSGLKAKNAELLAEKKAAMAKAGKSQTKATELLVMNY
jgi:hypothetical protein